jgi:hypothetical protein
MEEAITTKKNFERINYSLRPAKHIERKMFCETFSRLSILDSIKNYRYIGMGSAYFSDFSLFHKTLGITKLLSIEGEDEEIYKQRIWFNKPFGCIDVEFGLTYNVLPRLPWQKWKEKSIVWLDYVDKLNEPMFGDIDTAMLNIKSGSVFLISVNIEEDDERDEKINLKNLSAKDFRLNQLKENIGRENIPASAKDGILSVEKNKTVIREIINNAIKSSMRKRNNGADDKNQVEYMQLFNLYYRDSADMLTVGGIIYDNKQKSKIEMMFKNLDFIRTGEDCFNIIVPKLTYREIHALDKALPDSRTKTTGIAKYDDKKIPLSKTDVKNYANIYRYFPTFAETNL